MDTNALVQQITNEVLKQLNLQTAATHHSNEPTPSSRTDIDSALVVLNSNLKNINEIYSALNKLNKKYKVSILLSKTASRVIGADSVISNSGVSSVYSDNNIKNSELYNFGCVVLPNLTLSTLSKISNMINDCILTDVVLYYLINKKPVYIGLDFLRYLISMNPTATSSIQEYILKLKKMGASEIKIGELSDLNLGAGEHGFENAGRVTSSDVKNMMEAGAERIGKNYDFNVDVPAEAANLIDHTILKPDVTRDQIIKHCEEARKYEFASVCVNPGWVKLSSERLKGSSVKVCTVIGFPLGATTTAVKAAETRDAVSNGADEIDMVINIGALKAGDNECVLNDIKAVVESAQGKIVKVILETSLLSDEEKIRACKLCKQAHAHYVKTSTGFSTGGATLTDIALMRMVVGPDMGVKASGGVRDFNQVRNLVEVGATRIGASASIAIVSGGKGTGNY